MLLDINHCCYVIRTTPEGFGLTTGTPSPSAEELSSSLDTERLASPLSGSLTGSISSELGVGDDHSMGGFIQQSSSPYRGLRSYASGVSTTPNHLLNFVSSDVPPDSPGGPRHHVDVPYPENPYLDLEAVEVHGSDYEDTDQVVICVSLLGYV